MSRWISLLLVLALTLGMSANLRAAGLEEELTRMATENAKGYLGPLSTAFGTALNSGLYQTAKTHPTIPSIPGFDVMVKFSLVDVKGANTTYQFLMPNLQVYGMNSYDVPGFVNVPDTIEFNTNILYPDHTVPTLFGTGKPNPLVPDANGVGQMVHDALIAGGMTEVDITRLKTFGKWDPMIASIAAKVPTFAPPPGMDIPYFPMVMPQVDLGLPLNSELGFRMLPTYDISGIGKLSFLGIGFKHSISQWIPCCPVDISGQYMWQQLKVGDILTSTHTQFNVHASKQLGFTFLNWTPYVGAGIESSTIDLKYTIDVPPGDAAAIFNGRTIEFSLPGDNKTRFTVGSRFILAVLAIDANYSVGAYTAYSLGVGFSFK